MIMMDMNCAERATASAGQESGEPRGGDAETGGAANRGPPGE